MKIVNSTASAFENKQFSREFMRSIKALPLPELIKILKKEGIPYWLPDESVLPAEPFLVVADEPISCQISPLNIGR